MFDPRPFQIAAETAYLLLGLTAIIAAVLRPERARLDVALLFGALGIAVVLQELPRVAGLPLPVLPRLATALILAVPYLLARLVDDFVDVPRWLTWGAFGLFVGLSTALMLAPRPAPAWLSLAATVYLVGGILYAAWAFIGRARTTVGITSRRMWSVAFGCTLLSLVFIIAAASFFWPDQAPYFTALSQTAGLLSGLAFYLGFFPPPVVRQWWRLPELFAYLHAGRLTSEWLAEHEHTPDLVAADLLAMDRLSAALTRTTGARRALLAIEDPARGDLAIWGAPSARIQTGEGPLGAAYQRGRPVMMRNEGPEALAAAVRTLFGPGTLPQSVIAVPVQVGGRVVGALGVYAEKGPIFLEDDLDMLTFFAADAAAILRGRQFREAAQELAALREADRLKNEFMAVVSHELRTPLTAISGYADILLRQISGPLTERQERQVTGIRDAARRLLALINDLLDVSRLEAGTLDLHPTPVDAHAAAVRAVASVRVIAQKGGVHLEVDQLPDELAPPLALADAERLQQMLVNLLSNAIKFTPAGGRVSVSVSVEPGVLDEGRVVFAVSDTGVGLAPEQLERVWDRFYQAEGSATRRFGGAGLGLSIVKRLAELHSGSVGVESPGLNQGSTFLLRLPGAPAGALESLGIESGATPVPTVGSTQVALPTTTAAARGETSMPRARTLLVVEDDPDVAVVLRTYLEAEGYAVEHAADGQRALQLARQLRPFAITLDVMLPKLDGWSVLSALKRDPSTADIPVVVISIVENRGFGLVLGVNDYLVKPIEHERLRAVLHRLAGTPQPGDGTILLVEDDPAVRDVLHTSLSRDGWKVRVASSGEEALNLVATQPPAAVVLDLLLPGLDGFAVLQSLRANPATRTLPVLVITGKELTDDDRRKLLGAAQRVLLKGTVSLEGLSTELRDALAAHRAAEQPASPRARSAASSQASPDEPANRTNPQGEVDESRR